MYDDKIYICEASCHSFYFNSVWPLQIRPTFAITPIILEPSCEGGCHASPIDRLYTPRQLATQPRNLLLLGHHVSIVAILLLLLPIFIIVFLIIIMTIVIMVNICMTRQAWLSMWSQTKPLEEQSGDLVLPGRLFQLFPRWYRNKKTKRFKREPSGDSILRGPLFQRFPRYLAFFKVPCFCSF